MVFHTLFRFPTNALICIGLVCNVPSAFGQESAPRLSNYYSLEARVFSVDESDVLGSYEGHASGSTDGWGGKLGLGVAEDNRIFVVKIAANQKDRRFTANLSIHPDASDRQTKARDVEEIDLSDLKSRTIDLVKAEDGRVYRVTIVPRVLQQIEPRTFRISDLRMDTWRFEDSTVILNDQDYLGSLNASGLEIAFVDVPGLAKVEFSLLPLTGAKPEGVLENGTLRIKHNDETLRITNVKNGIGSSTLPGEVPYHVWVRWNKPSQTIDEYRESMKLRIKDLRERSARGDIDVSNQTLERLEHAVQSGRVLQFQRGVRGAQDADLRDADSTEE